MTALVKGLIHCHSENSRYDSGMSVKALVKKAKELGYQAVSLTDHGTLSGIDDFLIAAEAEGIKPIYGVELYVKKAEEDRRLHLVVVAKDDLGIKAINKVVTESNLHIDNKGKPIATLEILEKYFSETSKYHGHVFATSACVSGVLAGEYLKNIYIDEDIAKIKKKLKNIGDEESYQKNKESLEKTEEHLNKLSEIKEGLQKLAKKPYKKKENALKKLEGKPEYEEALNQLNAEKQESKNAASALERANLEITLTRNNMKSIKEQITSYEATVASNKPLVEKIEALEKSKTTKEEAYANVKSAARYYDKLFGHGNFFVELQYHGYIHETTGIDIEKAVFPVLVEIAKEENIPMSVATDGHMPDGSEESIRIRYIMRALSLAQYKILPEINPGDHELYLKSEKDLKKSLMMIADEETIDQAIENTYMICGACEYQLKAGEHYPKFNGCRNGMTASEELRAMAEENISVKFPDGFSEEYKKRLNYELEVISSMGYSDYFLIVQDFLSFGRKLGYLSSSSLDYLREHIKEMSLDELNKYVDSKKEKNGIVVGPGRGSAAGSLVAYLVGITNIIDPIKYDLLFERFLNKDRVSMPEALGI